jgi:hypothetical protein
LRGLGPGYPLGVSSGRGCGAKPPQTGTLRPSGVYFQAMNIIGSRYIELLLAALQSAGGHPLIVGGAVRDLLRGVELKDIDVEVYGLPIAQLAETLAQFGRVDAVGRSFGVLKLRLPDGQEVDVSLPRRESKIGAGHRGFLAEPDPTMTPGEAAARRDFTWNALALTPDGQLLDFFGGADDLRAGVIRHTTPHHRGVRGRPAAGFAGDAVCRALRYAPGAGDGRAMPRAAARGASPGARARVGRVAQVGRAGGAPFGWPARASRDWLAELVSRACRSGRLPARSSVAS